MQLHIWNNIGSLQSFDPECLAALLLIESAQLPIEVHQSNNVLLGPLPALVDNGTTINGYLQIVHHLVDKGMVPYSAQDVCLEIFAERLTTLSLYLLFESTKNYETTTRPSISASVPFPMQYNLTIELQRDIKRRSESHGLYPTRQQQAAHNDKQKGVSKTHEKMIEEKNCQQAALKMTQKRSFVVAKAQQLYTDLDAIDYSMGPAYCIVAANLLIQSYDLPDPIFKQTLETHSKLLEMVNWAKGITAPIIPDRSYNLINYLKWKVGWISP